MSEQRSPGFIGPLHEWDWRCPVCGSNPYDQNCHHPDCPTVCPRPILTADHRITHRCPQTDEATAHRFAAICGTVDLPLPPIPEFWKTSERLAAYDQRRPPAAWAVRDAHDSPADDGDRDSGGETVGAG